MSNRLNSQKLEATVSGTSSADGNVLSPDVPSSSSEATVAANPYQALFDSIPQKGLKCDIFFLAIKNRIQEEPEYVKRLRVVFQFNITKNSEPAATWTCDTKTSIEGDVYRSAPKPGLKADCVLTVDDDDWIKIMVGRLNPQRAFMMSKFKIKGNIMLLQKLHAVWFELRRKGKTPELDLIQEIMVDQPLIPDLKSEVMAIEIVQRIVKMPFLTEKIDATLQINVLKQGILMTQYLIGMHPGKKPEFCRFSKNSPILKEKIDQQHQSKGGQLNAKKSNQENFSKLTPDVIFSIEDDDLVLVIYGIYKINELISNGRIKVEGKAELAERAKALFEQPPIMARL